MLVVPCGAFFHTVPGEWGRGGAVFYCEVLAGVAVCGRRATTVVGTVTLRMAREAGPRSVLQVVPQGTILCTHTLIGYVYTPHTLSC